MRFADLACLGLCLLTAGLACGRDRVEIIGRAPDAALPQPPCPVNLEERLTITTVPVVRDIAWQKPGYDNYPTDERVAMAVVPNTGHVLVAWTTVAGKAADGSQLPPQGVHVTSNDDKFAPTRDDVVFPTAREVSGLVAHEDGFALLTRDTSPDQLALDNDSNTVAFLIRHQNGRTTSVPLTGSQSGEAEARTLYSPFLDGQLSWDGSTYGAYFLVRTGISDGRPGFWRDLLAFRDGQLAIKLAASSGCDNNGGIRLIPDPGKANPLAPSSVPQMTGLCVQQVGPTGLKFTAMESDAIVSADEVGWPGYAGAKMGSLLKVRDGYLVFWLSLGGSNEHQGHDIRMARLDSSTKLVSGPTWFSRTPGTEEWNLHVVPYGSDHFLMVYEEIAIGSRLPNDFAVYPGTLLATHMAVIDREGIVLSEARVKDAPTTANDEPVVLPNGDVAWVFVNPSPDLSQTVSGPNGPGQTNLNIARVRNCQ
jgi:hypothetical protein